MKFINDWRKAHRYSSVWVAIIGALGALLGGIGALLSGVGAIAPWLHTFAEWANEIPRWVIWFGGFAFCVGFIIARIWQQKPPKQHWNKRGELSKWR